MADFNNGSDANVSLAGIFGWMFFNILGMISNDQAQLISYACAGFSALTVGVYHIVKTIYTIKGKYENKDRGRDSGSSSNSGDSDKRNPVQ